MDKKNEEYDVLILGGGTSGLCAAHELAEKKLKVCVLEAAPHIGGKPISAFGYPLKPPDPSATDEQLKTYLSSKPEEDRTVKNRLPVEHGFRVYPENYNNLLSVMRRIPTEDGGNVSDQLTNVLRMATYSAPLEKNKNWWHSFLSKLEKVFFGLALYTPYIICEQRSLKYDEVSIDQLFRLENRSPELAAVILGLTDSLSSGMLNQASTLAVVNILMNYYYAPQRTGFRTFDRPTHVAWLIPWDKQLKKLNVNIEVNTRVIGFNLDTTADELKQKQTSIKEVIAIQDGVQKTYKAKYIISALPVDVLTNLINQNYEMLRYDSRLVDLYKIMTLPATGVQLYYETPIKGIEKKLFAGSIVPHPWGLSYVDQNSYWKNPQEYTGPYGVISIYLSVTNRVGTYIKKSFQKCTANEIAYEMFTEVENELKKRNIHIPKRVGYYTHSYQNESQPTLAGDDPMLASHFNGRCSEDMLHLCVVGMKKWRPLPETRYLGNLHLCGSYTNNQTYYVSTMEAASESGRRAASAILQAYQLPPLTIYEVQLPGYVKILRGFDKFLYTFFLPSPFDLILALLRKTLNNKNTHMDKGIRSYEDLHW